MRAWYVYCTLQEKIQTARSSGRFFGCWLIDPIEGSSTRGKEEVLNIEALQEHIYLHRVTKPLSHRATQAWPTSSQKQPNSKTFRPSMEKRAEQGLIRESLDLTRWALVSALGSPPFGQLPRAPCINETQRYCLTTSPEVIGYYLILLSDIALSSLQMRQYQYICTEAATTVTGNTRTSTCY